MIDKKLIADYSKRNTSPRMPIESKYLRAYLDALLNSTSVEILYQNLKEVVSDSLKFNIFLSYWSDCKLFADKDTKGLGFYKFNRDTNQWEEIVRKIPLKELISFSMIKKNLFVYELMTDFLFTGVVNVYASNDESGIVVTHTDEIRPIGWKLGENTGYITTDDNDITTDMQQGLLRLGFMFYYTEDDDDNKIEGIQTKSGLINSMELFYKLLTIIKPARLGVWVYFIPIVQITLKKLSENENEKVNEYVFSVSKNISIIEYSDTFKIKWLNTERANTPYEDALSLASTYELYEYGNDYQQVSNPSGNPKENRYYEYRDGEYYLSEDDSVVSGKIYYVPSYADESEMELYLSDKFIKNNPWITEESDSIIINYEPKYKPNLKILSHILGHVRLKGEDENENVLGNINFDIPGVMEQGIIRNNYHFRLEVKLAQS